MLHLVATTAIALTSLPGMSALATPAAAGSAPDSAPVAAATIPVTSAATSAGSAPTTRLLGPAVGADVDRRHGRVRPTSAQLDRVRELAATARWTRFGTPSSLIRYGAALATGVPGEPVEAARSFLTANRVLFGMSTAAVADLRVVRDVPLPGRRDAHVVVFGQRAGRLPVADGGLITVGVVGARISYLSSSAIRDPEAPPTARLSPQEAWRLAAAEVGRPLAPGAVRTLQTPEHRSGWTTFEVAGMAQVQRARLVAVGVPGTGVRAAYQVDVVDVQSGSALAVTAYVDAVDGTVLVRHNRVDHLGPVPQRATHQPIAGPVCDVVSGCDLLRGAAALPDWATPGVTGFTDGWHASRCDVGALPDEQDGPNARKAALATRGGFHRWTADLGLRTPAQTRVKVRAGAVTGGYPTYLGRNDASLIRLRETVPAMLNLYLFQPVAARWYGPCADSAFDATVITHELGHAVIDNAVAGSRGGLASRQGRAMGEAWADLLASERFLETGDPTRTDGDASRTARSPGAPGHGRAPAVGAYVSGNAERGLRNYRPDANPLGYADLGYDIAGSDPDTDAGIWTAVNWDVREAMRSAYDADSPSSDAVLQRSCATGHTPVDHCPGNRRWAQLLVDSLLLQQGRTSMPAGRDALLAADRMRFDGANAGRIWHAFAARGLGERAGSRHPAPDYTAPTEAEGTLIFDSVDYPSGRPVAGAKIYVGRYTARVHPVAETRTAPLVRLSPRHGALPDRVSLVPGRYSLTWVAPGYGMNHTRVTVAPATTSRFTLHLVPDLAAAARGAEAIGPGQDPGAVVDGSEATDWSVTRPGRGVRGARIAVDLAGTTPVRIRAVRVSAMLHPVATGHGTRAQNRFTALRSFALEACTATATVRCDPDGSAGWRRVYTSAADAFPGLRPRPATPDLALREFAVPETTATALRLVVRSTQCTGAPAYRSEQESDPLSTSGCLADPVADTVRVAELMAYGYRSDELPAAGNHDAWG